MGGDRSPRAIMAGRRHKSPSRSVTPREQQDKQFNTRVRALIKAGYTPDPSNRKRVNDAFRKLESRKRLEKEYTIRAPKEARTELKKRGFVVSKRGVLIDTPRAKGEHIKGAKAEIFKDGTVKFSVKDRRDYIVGFTAKEKKEFAKNPAKMIEKKTVELREKYPTLRRIRKIQTRLQWGVFSATKDFSPFYFTRQYFAEEGITKKTKRKKGIKKIDKLTGLHFIVHTPRRKHAAKSKAKGKRSRRS